MCRCRSLFLILISTSLVTYCWGADVDSPQCVYYNVENCPTSTEGCKCHIIETNNVYCCNINGDFELKQGLACSGVGHPVITALHIRNATLSKLDANSDKWRYLVSLSVTDSHIPRLNKIFGNDFELTCLNLSNNGLIEVNPRLVQSLPKLSKLDLSHNNLTELPEVNGRISHFFMDIANNPQLLCQSLSDMVTKYDSSDSSFSVHFLNKDSTFCVQPASYHWFNSTDRVPFSRIKMKSKMDKVCPRGDGYECSCDVFRFENNYNGSSRYSLQVDCSHRKLTALPKPLPPFTVMLNVSYNNITGIDELSIDESYSNIRYFVADHNQIRTFTVLEGSRFLDDFVHLSLDHNNIKTLPIYILSNAIDRVSGAYKEITLGENRLLCDCLTAQVTRYWLINNKRVIRDYDNVWCENVKDKVIELDQNKVCIYQKDWSDYIHYIIAIEILLFILLISKVSYDYWVFKSAGYLPWPASKMPKLPCDWVFE